MLNDIKEVLYSEAYIDSMVKRVGAEISRDYADKNLLLVSVLKGSVEHPGQIRADGGGVKGGAISHDDVVKVRYYITAYKLFL